jgi:DNA-binding transcriptional LysR family regulator
MNLYHLRYFVTLAHLEHYTKAAEILGITQPSLSHAISSLEEELKVRLFEKDGRNVVLTRWGNVFLKDVEEILAHLDSSVANLKMTGSGNGTIDIGCIRVLGASYVPGLMREFVKANPDKNISYRLHCEGGLSADIIEGLKNRQYDIAFCSKYKDDPSIDFVKVASQDLVMAVPIDHPLAAQDSIKLKDTLAYPQILFDRRSGLRDIIDSLFAKAGGYPDCIMEIEEDMVIAGLVSQGFGIAVVPDMHIFHELPIKTLTITEPVPERDFYMASLKGTYFAPLVMSFKEFAVTYQYKSKYIF